MGEPRAKRGRPRSEAAKRQILQAALDLLHEVGVSGVTMEAIAARSGVSKTTIYRWWSCAPAVALEGFLDEVAAHMEATKAEAPLPALRARIRRLGRLMNGPLGDVLAGLIAATESDRDLATAFRDGFLKPRREDAKRLLKLCVDDGSLRSDLDLEIALDVLSGALYNRRCVTREPITPRIVEKMLEYVFEGLTPRR